MFFVQKSIRIHLHIHHVFKFELKLLNDYERSKQAKVRKMSAFLPCKRNGSGTFIYSSVSTSTVSLSLAIAVEKGMHLSAALSLLHLHSYHPLN